MARSLSISRRKVGLIDCSLPARTGVASYNFQWATNFDQGYATFQNVPNYGIMSPSVRQSVDIGFTDTQYARRTRFVFSPADYGIPDANPIWLRIQQVNNDGTIAAFEAGQLVLPYSSQPNRDLVIAGTAPSATAQSGALEIQLPMQVHNPTFQNNSASTDLLISFDPGGAEFRIKPIATAFELLTYTFGANAQLFVRGDGATCSFQMLSSLRNNPPG